MRVKSVRAVSPIQCLLMVAAVWCSMAAAPVPSLDAPRTYVHPRDFDFETLLGGPPANDSAEHADEMATLLGWQNRRTAQQVNRCQREAKTINVWLFSDVVGDDFNRTTHPLTAAFFDEIVANTEPVVHAAKRHWNRPRPAAANPMIVPCVPAEVSTSYPSGHAANAMVEALILSEIFPDQKDALIARGKLVGTDRVIAGIHYPTDVAAGQKLGEEIAHRLLNDPNFEYELQRAAEECHAGSAAAGNQPATRPAAQMP